MSPAVSLLPEKGGGDLLDDIDSLLKQGVYSTLLFIIIHQSVLIIAV